MKQVPRKVSIWDLNQIPSWDLRKVPKQISLLSQCNLSFLAVDSSAFESLFHNVGEEIVLVDSSVVDQDQGRHGWYNQLDHFVFVEDLVAIVIPHYTTLL